jgi:acetylornithine deacetylase/succinyl-diaminopimelate desuccinylase-like protein
MAEGTAAAAVPAGLGAEAVSLLQRLIRIDTVNPPGNERPLQEELAAMLSEAGYECELLEAEPGRANLLARLRGGDGPTLTYLGHVDTVRADAEEWSRDPWGGELEDGWVWGRGALDMKGQVAAEVAAAIELVRDGWRPEGELLLVITADEEAGGNLGARWLCEQHPAKVRSDLVVNEGGGHFFEYGDRRLYTLALGEKGIFRVRLRTRGAAGHASLPRIGDNALIKLARLLAKLADQPPLEPTPEGLAFLSALTGEEIDAAGLEAAVASVREANPLLADFLAEPILGVTLTPTLAESGRKANVIPSSGEALIDCRVPPGLDEGDARRRVEELLGPGDYELEFSEAVIGNRSELDTPLAGGIGEWLAEADPGAELAPIAMPGFSDSHWFRAAFPEATVYGFCPLRDLDLFGAAPLIHGADERVPAADVELAAGFFHSLARRLLA